MIRAHARSIPRRRALLLGAAVVVAAAAVGVAGSGSETPTSRPVAPLAERLGVRTWALAIPASWLAAPIPGLRDDDVLDLIGTRSGERAVASDIATGLRVVSSDERVLIVELTDADASAIASARARGLSLIPILRSDK